jgi:DNA-binding NarL/FixJ family response regulator
VKTKLIIADDHQLFADGLQNLLALEGRFEFMTPACDGADLLKKIALELPHLVLLDVSMPNMNGVETVEVLHREYPSVRILIVTMNDQPETLKTLIRLGVNGIVLKNTGKAELMLAIDEILAGQSFFSQKITRALAVEHSTVGPTSWHLTKREREVLKLLGEGLSTAEIAHNLQITTFTVDTHRKNLLTKSGLSKSAQLIRRAQELGYLPK